MSKMCNKIAGVDSCQGMVEDEEDYICRWVTDSFKRAERSSILLFCQKAVQVKATTHQIELETAKPKPLDTHRNQT